MHLSWLKLQLQLKTIKNHKHLKNKSIKTQDSRQCLSTHSFHSHKKKVQETLQNVDVLSHLVLYHIQIGCQHVIFVTATLSWSALGLHIVQECVALAKHIVDVGFELWIWQWRIHHTKWTQTFAKAVTNFLVSITQFIRHGNGHCWCWLCWHFLSLMFSPAFLSFRTVHWTNWILHRNWIGCWWLWWCGSFVANRWLWRWLCFCFCGSLWCIGVPLEDRHETGCWFIIIIWTALLSIWMSCSQFNDPKYQYPTNPVTSKYIIYMTWRLMIHFNTILIDVKLTKWHIVLQPYYYVMWFNIQTSTFRLQTLSIRCSGAMWWSNRWLICKPRARRTKHRHCNGCSFSLQYHILGCTVNLVHCILIELNLICQSRFLCCRTVVSLNPFVPASFASANVHLGVFSVLF